VNKAFLDTTILADILLKPGAPSATAAKAALGRFDSTLLPVYAIKEFKAGPLLNFVWFHNKLVSLNSIEKAIGALQTVSRSPHRYKTATALEALRASAYSSARTRLDQLCEKYGATATKDCVERDECRLAIKSLVFRAWRRRRSVTSEVVEPLSCYEEKAPHENRGLLELKPTRCNPRDECSLGNRLRTAIDELQRLKDATDAQDSNPELLRRSRALREVIRKPGRAVSEQVCRHLGDAVFAFLAPADATILTTNLKDHVPLANALGKNVEAP
jgi:hypothetical protein